MAETLLATNRFPGDGVTTQFLITFAGGFIERSHVRAFIEDNATRARLSEITITPGMWIDDANIDLGVAAAIGQNVLILRDTPKDGPLVDFTNRGRMTEANLDKIAKQAVFSAAESSDATSAAEVQNIYIAAGTATAAADTAVASATAAGISADEAAASAALINTDNFATVAQGLLAESALQPGEAASPAQGALANSALQPGAIGTSVQAFDANTAKTNLTQNYSKAQSGSIVALTDGASISLDLALSNNFSVTLAGSRTLANPTNVTPGQSGIIIVNQDATGSRTLSYGSNYKFGGGIAPVLSTTANAQDALTYFVISSTRIWVSLVRGIA